MSEGTLDEAEWQGLEALLFLADEPLGIDAIAEALQRPAAVTEAAVQQLAARYEAERRGMEVRRAAGGWRMYTAPGARAVIERWALAGRTGRLTQAALETLAVIAYKQPIGRQEISDIRGVNADAAVRSLVARGLVAEVGRDAGPGQAVLYGTTSLLLERLGLDSLEELPELTDYLPEAPAPDEPELGQLKEIRRRLAAGEELPVRGRSDAAGVSTIPPDGAGPEAEPDDEDDLLPPPQVAAGTGRDDAAMDALTDQLERAARNAVERLRAAVAAGEQDDDEDAAPDADAAQDEDAAPDADAAQDEDAAPDDPGTQEHDRG